MLDSLYVAWRYLAFNRLRTATLIACVTLLAALPAALQVLLAESDRQLRARAAATPLLLGAKGSALDGSFVLLAVLSTLVAAIGLAENNVAVVIGAMVIAPLLGPNIALAFGTSLGDGELAWQALNISLAGLALPVTLSFGLGIE